MEGHFDYTRVAERTLNSIFCVEATPIHQVLKGEERAEAQYKQRIKLVATTVSQRKKARLSQVAQPQVAVRQSKPNVRNATGFVVARSGSRLRILTCAHLIDDCYTAGLSITVNEVNTIFYFEVTCAHEEAKVHDQLGTKDISKEKRTKARAYCVALDTQKDLMLLQVQKVVSGSSGDEWLECTQQHPLIQMTETIPTKLEACILQGWPPQSIECYSVGNCSFFSRTYSSVTQLNPKGYTMRLVDLSGMVALDGCSGGPVINANRDCLGVYHGVISHVRGYAISALDVREFLAKSDTLSWDIDVEVQVDAPTSPGGQADVSAAGQDEPANVAAAAQGEEADVPIAGQGGVNTRRSERSRKPNVRLAGNEWSGHM